jgi:hypothetical protein
MATEKILNAHGIETRVITNENGNHFVMANNEDGTWTKFEYFTASSIIYKYLGY